MARNGVKTGGRQIGSLNKVTREKKVLESHILNLIESQYLEEDLKQLTPHQRVSIYTYLVTDKVLMDLKEISKV